MANFDKLDQYLHKIVQNLSQGRAHDFNHQNIDKISFKEEFLKLQNNYYGDTQKSVLMTKIKLLQIMQKLSSQQKQLVLSMQQKNIVNQLSDCLNTLNKQMDYLLNEGILTIYLELSDIQAGKDKKNIHSIITQLVQNIIQGMSNLLKVFFIYQQYRNRRPNQTRAKSRSVFSLRNLNQSAKDSFKQDQKNEFDMKLMKGIQQNMSSKSIHDLISNYMEKQIVSIKKKEQICRICSNKIRLQNIQKHVKLCQKKSDFKQNLQNKTAHIEKLNNQIRQELDDINEKSTKTEQDQSLKKVITALLYKQKSKRQRGVLKRSQSMMETNKERFIKLSWQKYLQDYQNKYGKHEVLDEILECLQKKVQLQKQINGLQLAALITQTNESQSSKLQKSISDAKNAQGSEQTVQETQLSNSVSFSSDQKLSDKCLVKFAPNQKDYCKQSSSSLSSEQGSNRKIKEKLIDQNAEKLKIYKSRQNLTKQTNQEIDISIQKRYVSLQQIPLGQDQEDNVSLDSFQIIKMLGQGAYGKVYMVRRKRTSDIYAMKIITLSEDCTEKQLQTIGNQHQIFKKIAGDHLVKAPFSFSERASHMFILQFMPGGDLRKLLTNQVYFQQQAAKFYLAEIILAIEHLHKQKIIHRDLKPQNLVIDQFGHLKLTDFGLSELQMSERLQKSRKMNQLPSEIKRRPNHRVAFRGGNKIKLIGTPDYIAPQIINNVSTTNMTIDWWSLGVMAYELVIGTRPFCADTIEDVIQNIQAFNFEWPQVGDQQGMISAKAKDLIQQLLNKDFLNRLGANGADEIKTHPFFEGTNWDNIKSQSPPFKPDLSKVQQQVMDSEDPDLRNEIEKMIGTQSKSKKSKLNLQKFVRFDLLGNETIQNVEKIYNEKATRLRKLKTIQNLAYTNMEQIEENFN